MADQDNEQSNEPAGRRQGSGWRWMIAFSCAWMNFFHRGLIRSMAVVYVQLIQTFGITREEAALPLSLVSVIAGCSGLSVGVLMHYLNDRILVVIATLISATGLVLCYTATNMTQINFYYSISQGLGTGLVFTLTAVILNNVFKKNRATASGINLSGPTLVALVFPVLFQYCSRKYGLRGAFLIASGFTLNALPAAFLLSSKIRKPIEPVKEVEPEIIKNPRYDCEINMTGSTFTLADVSGSTSDIPSKVLARTAARNLCQGAKGVTAEKEKLLEQKSAEDRQCSIALNGNNNVEVLEGDASAKNLAKNLRQVSKGMQAEKEKYCEHRKSGDIKSLLASNTAAVNETAQPFIVSKSKNIRAKEPLAEKEKLLDHSASEDRKGKAIVVIANGTTRPKSQEIPIDYPDTFNSAERASSIPIVKGNLPKMNDKLSKVCGAMTMFKDMFSSPYFLLVTLSQVSHVFNHSTFITIIIDYAKDHGIDPEQGIYILLANSGGDLVGRLGLGWISDKKLIERRNMMLLNYLFTGILMHLAPYCNSYSLLTALAVTMALCGGSTITLFSVLFLEYLGIRLMPLAYGLSNFITGNANFFRPKIIGYYRDAHGKYDDLFRLLGSFQLFVSFLWLLACIFEKYKAKKMAAPPTPKEDAV
ncbi:uncharacterized protein ISCGN_006931 [Ixodes scapularis]